MTRLCIAILLATIPTLQLAAGQAKPAPKLPTPRVAVAPVAPQPPVAPAVSHAAPAFGAAEQTALVKQYCVTCHNDRAKAGQLTLASFDAAQAAEHLETSE